MTTLCIDACSSASLMGQMNPTITLLIGRHVTRSHQQRRHCSDMRCSPQFQDYAHLTVLRRISSASFWCLTISFVEFLTWFHALILRPPTSVPGRLLHPSLWCRQSTASEICQSSLPNCSAVSTKYIRPSGLRCWGSDGLELTTGQSPWSIALQQQP